LRTPALLAACLLLLTACSQAGAKVENPNDPYSGLEPEILKWRADIEAEHPACQSKIDGKGCEAFEVTCKGAEALTASDRAQGVTARIVSAMNFSGRMADGSTGKSGSAFAEFSKTGGAWTRAEAKPVNPTTCAGF
jgi:hypothetical protein